MWLSWKGLPNQICIDREPRMKFMIMEYNNTTNEVLFVEIELRNYCPFSYQEEVEPQEELPIEVFLVQCSPPTNLVHAPQST